jgi:hypothetical protein
VSEKTSTPEGDNFFLQECGTGRVLGFYLRFYLVITIPVSGGIKVEQGQYPVSVRVR